MESEKQLPEEIIASLKVEGGAIILPEGLKGRELKQCNKVFKLHILKRKLRRKNNLERKAIQARLKQALLEDKLKKGQLILVSKRLKNQ